MPIDSALTYQQHASSAEYQDDRGQARADEIASYLAYYNNERRHSALDYLSPYQFETLNDHPI